MNIISQYEQGYLSYSEFINEFPDSISESQEALYGAKCVDFYVSVTLGKTDCHYYVKRYGGDQCENDERCSFEGLSAEDSHPFGPVLACWS